MASTAVSALMQAAMRRRLLTRERALELGRSMAGCGTDIEAVREKLASSPAPDAIMLRELLAPPDAPLVEPYQRVACLGEGRTASAWLAIGPAPHGETAMVVLKIFNPTRLPLGEDVERFLSDVGPLIGQKHKYLVDYYAAFAAADGRAVVAQEYLPGRDLAARATTKGAMAEPKALPLLRQAAKGLAQLVQLESCHGLLHPGNIMLDGNGRARLNDYGFAYSRSLAALRPGWDARSLMLHAWAAPEAQAEAPHADIVADTYALGCIGFWLLGGKTPFPGTPDRQTLQHVGAARPDVRKLAPKVSALTAKTLLKAMQIDPRERYEDPRELIASLQRNFEKLKPAPEKPVGEQSGVRAPVHVPPAQDESKAVAIAKRPELDLEE